MRPSLDIELTPPFDDARAPARPGVVVFEGEGGSCVLVAATGDVRAFVGARLGAGADGRGARADLRPVTTRVRAATVGSALEGDLVCLEVARERLPATYRALADRCPAWFIHLDPGEPAPTWRKINLLGVGEELPAGALLGPIPDKHAAARFGEALDDLFELCRYPRELARAPRGTACAYKEMGRCPAACDGSEPMDAYRARVRAAIACWRDGTRVTRDAIERDMREAAGAHDFERAAALKARMGGLDVATKPRFANVGVLDDLALVLALPGERAGWARLVVFAGGELTAVADVEGDVRAGRAWDEIERAVLDAGACGGGFAHSGAAAERLGVICSHWFRRAVKGRRRRPGFVDLRRAWDARAVRRAIRAAATPGEADEFRETEVAG